MILESNGYPEAPSETKRKTSKIKPQVNLAVPRKSPLPSIVIDERLMAALKSRAKVKLVTNPTTML